jgi:hypothetical protein
MCYALLFSAVLALAETPEPGSAPHPDTRPVAGLGVAVGGGALFGFAASFRLNDDLWLDTTTGFRVADGGTDSFMRRAFMVGVWQELAGDRARPGWYAKAGTTLPPFNADNRYMDTFVSGGFHSSFYTAKQGSLFTLQAGPGIFVYRNIPGVDPGLPLMWYARASWQRTVLSRH